MQTHADVKRSPRIDTPDQRGVPEIGPLAEHLDVATVIKISQAVSGEIEIEKLVEVLLRTAIEQTGAERALLVLPRGNELWIQAQAKTHGDSVTVQLSEASVSPDELPESVVRYVARTQEIVILDDASARNPYSTDAYFRKQGLRSILCLPLMKQSTLIALLYLESNIGPNIFAPAKIAVMRVLASAAAISLNNSRLYRELQEGEGRIRRLVDANIIGVLISDSEGQVIESNDAFLKMVGYTRKELVSGRMCWRDMTPVEWKDVSERGVVQVNTTGVCNVFEKEYFRKDGSRVPVLVGAARFEKNSIIAFAIDLTERKRAEEALQSISRDLQESKAKLEEAQRITHVGYWERDIVTGHVTWSDETYRIFGLQPQERPMDLNVIMQMVHPEDRQFVSRTQKEALVAGPRYDFEYRLLRPTGELRIVHAEGYIKKDASGQPYQAFGTVQDITDRKRDEEALRRSEFYLAEGQRLAHAGSWSFKPDLTCDYWSRELYEVLGFDPRNGIPTISDYFTRVHPQDRAVVESTIQRMIAAGEGCDLKKRIIRPDGVHRVIRCVGIPVREKGVVTRFVGTLMDITEQDELTQELRRSKAHLTNAQRLSHTGSVGMKVSSKSIFWSEESARIYGYPPGTQPTPELILQRVHPDDVALLKSVLEQAAQGGNDFEFEHRLLMPDGSIKYIFNLSQCVRDEAGNEEIVGAITDITERKLAEAAIRRSEAFLAEGQRLSHTGSWGWNASTGKLTWSQEHFRILGLDPKEANASLDVFWERIHPDDRAGVRHDFESAIQNKKDFEHEFRIVTPDWSIRYLHGVGHAVLNRANELVEFIGSTMDITERKRAEERTQSYNEAIRLALNAFVEELDVDRFLGHVMTSLTKQFQATSCELWLFDDTIGATSLHLVYQQGKMIEAKTVGLRTSKLHTTWQPSNIGRIPRIIEIFDQASLLQPTHLELLKEQGVKMLMAVPLSLGDQNLGVVELRFQEATKFTRDDLNLAQALVHHATLALQLSRLAHRTEQMAVMEERNRMAREIHDTLAQAFAGVVLHSEALGTALGESKSRSKKALSNIQKLARSGLEEARRSVQALRPKALEGRTLTQALAQEAKRLSEDGKHSCEFKQKGGALKLSAEIQNEFFRIAQEAMTNISKHAQAKSVLITLELKDNQATLTVRDDGIGFAATDSPKPKGGYGLSTMRERALRIGGKLEIESAASGGTAIRVVVPLDKKLKPTNHST